MEILQAILLGTIEGITEFLPVSSTGHLIVAEEYMSFHDGAKVFTITIQLAAMLAVVWYWRQDLAHKIGGLFKNDQSSKRFFLNILIATIPAGIVGLLLDENFEKIATPKTIAAALIIGGVILWLVDRKAVSGKIDIEDSQVEKITYRQAIAVGLAQCLALVPGVSRSGASIVGGLLSGVDRVRATAFSFYIGIPLLGSAGAYKLFQNRGQLSADISGGGLSIVIGSAVSFIVALAAVSWLLKYVSTHNFRIFAYYRILLGLIILGLLA